MRVDDFEGSTDEYVEHLEGVIHNFKSIFDALSTVQPNALAECLRALQNPSARAECLRLLQNPSARAEEQLRRGASKDPASSCQTVLRINSLPQTRQERRILQCIEYFSNIPHSSQWKSFRDQSAAAQSEWIIRFLVDDPLLQAEYPLEWKPFRVSRQSTADCAMDELERAKLYIARTAEFGYDLKVVRATLDLQSLIFALWGTVLEKCRGYNTDAVNKMMSGPLKLKSTRNALRYRCAGNWTSRVSSKLCAMGWGKRSFDLFAVCGWLFPKGLM